MTDKELRVTYTEEYLVDIWDEVFSLLHDHWKELARLQDVRPLEPDIETYNKLNELGFIRALVARLEGKIIGYASFHVANNLHYKSWMYAVCDVYYLDPKYRKTGIGLEFFRMITEWLKGLGVKSITVQYKLDHPHAQFFEKLGFKPTEQLSELVFE